MLRPALIAAALVLSSPIPLLAQGWIDVERRPNVTLPPTSVLRISSQVRVQIDGRVAKVEVEEQFRNNGGAIAEGTYLYPMPGEAVFTDFSLWMGEEEVRGEIMRAEQARGIYEEIVRRLKDPALLTLEGHGLIRARVFPIQPGETRKVVLRYTQMLDRSGDALRLRYAIGLRDRGRERGRGDTSREFRDQFSFRVTLPETPDLGTPYSPTHSLTTRRVGERIVVTLDPEASGDVELFVPLRRGLVGTSLVTHAPGGEPGFFMLLLAPPERNYGEVIPRDLSIVVDVSGSMSGDKLEQAKAAIRQTLGTLKPADRFRLVAFSSTVRHFRNDFVAATEGNVAGARRFADNLNANGGTNIAGALEAVLDRPASAERLPIIIFLTDGIPSVGEQAPDRIADAAGGKIGRNRIFTVGVGHDVNTYLLDRLAREGRGSAQYVAPDADVEIAVGALAAKIQHPALVNLRVAQSPVRLIQSYPAEFPDLFYGEELVIFGRYRGEGAGTVVIEGERNGRTERFTVRAAFPGTNDGNDFIPKLWASRRIGELTRQIRLDGANPALVSQVRDLGLRYGILTEYTSYLVQEPVGPGAPRDEVTTRERPGSVSNQRGNIGTNAAPSAQTGAGAFARADASAKLSSTGTLAESERFAERRFQDLTANSAEPVKRIGSKVFRLNNEIWVDYAHNDSLGLTSVAPYSDAYFELARALPELNQYLALGDEIVVAGKRGSIKITASGLRTWSTGQLARLVQSYRGS